MELTVSKRQKWIQEYPTVDEVLDKFPQLGSMKLVHFVNLIVQSLFFILQMQKEFLAMVSYQEDITKLIENGRERLLKCRN